MRDGVAFPTPLGSDYIKGPVSMSSSLFYLVKLFVSCRASSRSLLLGPTLLLRGSNSWYCLGDPTVYNNCHPN